MRIPIPLVGGSGGYVGWQVDPKRTINLYVTEMDEDDEKALVSIPGSKQVYTRAGANTTRAVYDNDDNLFVVYSAQVVRHDETLTAVQLGDLNTTAGYVGVAANDNNQVMFVDNVDGWVYNTGTAAFTEITAGGFPSQPTDVSFLDGHMLVAQSSSNKWFISDIDDATSWSALNFARITSAENERCVGIRVVNRRIFIFGRRVTEIFYNSGSAAAFPFVRDNNLVLQYGCASVATIAQDENMLVWLASQKDGAPTVRITRGGPSEKLSSRAMDYHIQSYVNPEHSTAYLYKIAGHTFYLINFLTDNATWVYDFSSRVWHEQQMINGDKYFSCCHAYFKNKHYLGHHSAGKLSELNTKYTTNDTENIHCVRITPIISPPSNERTRYNRFDLEAKQGIGAPTTKAANGVYDDFEVNPEIYLSVSRDGGVNYENPIKKSLGKVGETNFRTVWNGLGVSQRTVFKLETFHGMQTVLINAAVDVENVGY